MDFFLIKNIEREDRVVGILIESQKGQLVGRLEGDDGVNDPHRVVSDLLGLCPKQGFPIETADGAHRKVEYYKPGNRGFVRALLRRLRPPLKSSLFGHVKEAERPELVTSKLWGIFNPDEDKPPLRTYANR